MSASSSCAATDATASNGASLEELTERMGEMGVDQSVLNAFINLLARCNIFTMGALRAFHASMEELVGELYDDTTMGKLQAKGFLAMLRVRASPVCARRAQP